MRVRNTEFCEYVQQKVITKVQELSIQMQIQLEVGCFALLPHYRQLSHDDEDAIEECLSLERAARCNSSTIVSNISAHILKGDSGGLVGEKRTARYRRGCGVALLIYLLADILRYNGGRTRTVKRKGV